ncbi:MAG: serine/threonine-protein kinase [Gemmatales bacterium]
MSTQAPKTIGRFQLRSELGRGAFGHVYRAYDPTLAREVALKVPTLRAARGELARRFLREAQSAAKLRHPHLVPVYEAGLADDTFYIASEFVDGHSLVNHCKDHWPSARQSVEWVLQIAEALTYAHSEGIVHRDVKPANILIDQNGHARLTDFGLAKHKYDLDPVWLKKAAEKAGVDANLSRDGEVLGTPAYMAPEQARGKAKLTGPHSDQYSLGIVLYELLAGRVPFQGTLNDVLANVRDPEIKPPSPRRYNSRISPDLAAIVLRSIRKNPNRRYPSLNDFAIDLQRWQHGLTTSVRRRSSYQIFQKRTREWINSHPAINTFVATIILLISLAAITRGWLWDWVIGK